MRMKITNVILLYFFSLSLCMAQPDRWQQRVEYDMVIDMDVETNRFKGKQRLLYYNNSPDTLRKVFYHLYFNAFQPGSMMDVRSRTIEDPDPRVMDRIYYLNEDEIGYHNILSLDMNGSPCAYAVEGTILEVDLPEPILPNTSVTFSMRFESQVPVQIRRSGRDSKDGIRYSMAQWYPKMCEYDYQGWHANPYIGCEFHGVWGDFRVQIEIDRAYTIGGTGILKNADKMGHGYSSKDTRKRKLFQGRKLTWVFEARNVHDFVWAADPDYTHLIKVTDAGTVFHYFFEENEMNSENWRNLHNIMNEALTFLNDNYGEYPYPQYSFIQGGDGGMEYPMATLITGDRTFQRLVGTSIHELVHSWYQGVLANNESLYPWMDEGFTSFVGSEVRNHLRQVGLLPGNVSRNPQKSAVRGYTRFALSGREEPLSTHDDHYITNTAHSVAAYTKGSVFLKQIEYIIGRQNFLRGMRVYYDTWKFKHPNPNDFIRVMEKISGIELDWFKEYFVYTTHTIDYGIESVEGDSKSTTITLNRKGIMPMPVDLYVYLKDGTSHIFHIPMRIMRGEKPNEGYADKYSVETDWPWTHPTYEFKCLYPLAAIEKIVIDDSERLADVDLENNSLVPVDSVKP